MPNNSKQPDWIDEILHDFAPEVYTFTTKAHIETAKAAINAYILKEIIGEDEDIGDVPPFEENWKAKERFDIRSQLRTEQRTALTGQKEKEL